MTGTPRIINGICICYARLALTDGFGKWVPGTVLEIYPLDHKFNWGDEARFLIVKAKLTETQVEMVEERKLELPLNSFLSLASLEKYVANREYKSHDRTKWKADYLLGGEKPKLDRVVDVETFGMITPEKQWVENPIDDVLDIVKNTIEGD